MKHNIEIDTEVKQDVQNKIQRLTASPYLIYTADQKNDYAFNDNNVLGGIILFDIMSQYTKEISHLSSSIRSFINSPIKFIYVYNPINQNKIKQNQEFFNKQLAKQTLLKQQAEEVSNIPGDDNNKTLIQQDKQDKQYNTVVTQPPLIIQDEKLKKISDNEILRLETKQYISKHNIDVNLLQAFKDAANDPNHFLNKTIKLIKIYEKDASNFKVAAKEAFPALHADTQIAKIKRLLDELQRKGQLHDWYKEPTIFEIICNFFAQIFCKNDKELGFVPTVKKSKEGLQSGSSLSSI
jgi:hypothetical protein